MSSDKQMKTICGASENDLLENLQVSSQEALEVAQKKGRSKCPKCNGSRMFYCYTCYVPVESVPTSEIPSVKLPVKIDIIKHPNETDGKSTAVHAKLLAYEDVTIYTYPCIPDYDDQKHEVIMVFPSPNSVSLQESLVFLTGQSSCKEDYEPSPKQSKLENETNGSDNKDAGPERKHINCLKKVVFIDSTWNQTNKIIADERLQGNAGLFRALAAKPRQT
uniref:tRNA-uridine aminocarboxypropyltransferase 1 n=1 Tax=Pyxicephalus adspersus TaxID=30357 RepID=A0AAV3B6V0_PYXAD|nr:TPA: hypothetical protein GDO54_007561 [Pyxicephalus adspersus]